MLNLESSREGLPPTAKAVQASSGGGIFFDSHESVSHFSQKTLTINFQRIICSTKRPCKRPECVNCTETRRRYYVPALALFADLHEAREWTTISLLQANDFHRWELLIDVTKALYTKLNQRHHFLAWVRALGSKEFIPHSHLLTSADGLKYLREFYRQLWPHAVIHSVSVPTLSHLEQVAGYMFDCNFVPSSRDSRRPKYIRSIGGKQGVAYGHPKGVHWAALQNLRAIHRDKMTRAAHARALQSTTRAFENGQNLLSENFRLHVLKMADFGYINPRSLKTEQRDV